jgi:hypothetical protein
MQMELDRKKLIFFILLGLALLCIRFNNYIDILIICIITLCYCFMSLKENLYLYIFFMPFDEVLVIPKIGSIYRLLQFIILFKYCFLNIKGKVDFKFILLDIMFLLFLLPLILSSVLIYRDLNVLGLLINILIIIILRQYFQDNFNFHLSKVFKMFIISTCIAIIWGLIHQNFMFGGDQLVQMMRFSGTQEPNVMALYINISILFLLFLNWNIKNKIPLFIFLYIGLFLTVSMSGFMVNLIIICLFIIFNRNLNNFFISYFKYIVIFIFFIFLIVLFKDLPIIGVPLVRLQEKLNYVLQGNFSSATTGRTDLNSIYFDAFKQLNFYQKFIGILTFNNINILTFLGLNKINVSHNTYIDMLFSFGYLGLIIFNLYIILCLYFKKKNEYFRCLVVLKIVLLISGFTLSMFESRYFYIWMLL